MIQEIKPKLAKYAFEISMSENIMDYGLLMGAMREVLKAYPQGENEDKAWFTRYRNSMGTWALTIYIRDEELYQRLKPTVDKVKANIDAAH